ALHPGQYMTLKGYGREPVGADVRVQYDDINTPAITHRYDLVAADPQKPYLPKVDETLKDPTLDPTGYVQVGGRPAVDGSCHDAVGCIDYQTGKVTTGKGAHPRVYAIAILSVGDKAATWPIVFEPRRSYRPPTRDSPPPPPPTHPPRPPRRSTTRSQTTPSSRSQIRRRVREVRRPATRRRPRQQSRDADQPAHDRPPPHPTRTVDHHPRPP